MNKNTNGGYTAPQDKRQFLVAIYHREWPYSGTAEGGWYYNSGTLCSVSYRRFYHKSAAINYARRLNRALDKHINDLLPNYTCPNSAHEVFSAEVCKTTCEPTYPQRRPHYE